MPDGCKVALLVNDYTSSGFTFDAGTWSTVAQRGKGVLDKFYRAAVDYDGVGGRGYARVSIAFSPWSSPDSTVEDKMEDSPS